jgi:hypothetical protein
LGYENRKAEQIHESFGTVVFVRKTNFRKLTLLPSSDKIQEIRVNFPRGPSEWTDVCATVSATYFAWFVDFYLKKGGNPVSEIFLAKKRRLKKSNMAPKSPCTVQFKKQVALTRVYGEVTTHVKQPCSRPGVAQRVPGS